MATRRWTSRSHSPTIFVSYRERTILFPRTFVLTKRRKKHLRSDLRRHRLYFNVFLESSSISILSSEKRGDAECWQTRRTTRWSSRDDAVALREQTSPADIRANTCVPPLLVRTPRRDASSISSLSSFLSARTCVGQYRSNRSRRETARRLDHPPPTSARFLSLRFGIFALSLFSV